MRRRVCGGKTDAMGSAFPVKGISDLRHRNGSFGAVIALCLVLLGWPTQRAAGADPERLRRPTSTLTVVLHDQTLLMPVYAPGEDTTSLPLVVFSSGDGGWRDFENKNALWLSGRGYWVAGIDAAAYVKASVTESEVVDDYHTCFDAFRRSAGGVDHRTMILVGYSLGAELIALLSAHLAPSDGVTGLVLIGPAERGSVKIRAATSPARQNRSFMLGDCLANRGNLPVLLLHGELDRISAAPRLFASIEQPKRLSTIQGAGHLFCGGNADYFEALSAGLEWIGIQGTKNDAR